MGKETGSLSHLDRWEEHPEITDPCIILQGNLSDGYKAIGPFNGFDSAADYAEALYASTWIMTIEEPSLWEK
tara:strand:- start:354 stop:569 length:216 start_codon:yes stop_codon:yes gene_type:complete